ncbi:MAG: GNAT family N-acetyltransferase [Candidatus Roizmanbacteria bacterium]|nr:GNAT family N-acetyltransferase [Candidatus Roizmanbacteria bacterium]
MTSLPETDFLRGLEEEKKPPFILPLESFQMIDHKRPDLLRLQGVYDILSSPIICHRFANPPEDMQRMYEIATTNKIHILTALHPDPEDGRVIGTLSITDAHEPEHEHWIGHVGVLPEFHGCGVGTQLMEYGMYMGFTTRAYDERWRERLFMGVTLNKDYAAMLHLAQKLGFTHVWQLQQQMGIQTDYGSWAELFAHWREEMQNRDRTERHMITLDRWVLNAARGFYQTLNRLGNTDQIKANLVEQGISINGVMR